MAELHPCLSCHRHLDAGTDRCPFCTASQLAKGALGALALFGLTACPGSVKSVYAGPPPVPEPPPVEEAEGSPAQEDEGSPEEEAGLEPAPAEIAEPEEAPEG